MEFSVQVHDAFKQEVQQNQVQKDGFQAKEIVGLANFYCLKLNKPSNFNTQIKSHIHNLLKIKASLNSGTAPAAITIPHNPV